MLVLSPVYDILLSWWYQDLGVVRVAPSCGEQFDFPLLSQDSVGEIQWESHNSHWRDPRCIRLSCKSRSIPTVRLRSRPSQAFVESADFFHNDVGCGCDGHLWWDEIGICQSTVLLALMGAGIRIILDLPNVSAGTGSSDAITLDYSALALQHLRWCYDPSTSTSQSSQPYPQPCSEWYKPCKFLLSHLRPVFASCVPTRPKTNIMTPSTPSLCALISYRQT